MGGSASSGMGVHFQNIGGFTLARNMQLLKLKLQYLRAIEQRKNTNIVCITMVQKQMKKKIATIICQTAFHKYQNGQYNEAVEEYKRAINLAPNFAAVYRNWGVMESYENHLSEAIQLMEKAAELEPTDPQIFLLWGNVYRKKSKFQIAHEKYKIAHELSPKDPIILNALGQAKSRLGIYEEAHQLLIESSKADSSFSSFKHEIITKTSLAENLINWGGLLTKNKDFGSALKKYELAIENCNNALRLNIRDPKIFTAITKANLKKAHLLMQMNKEREAIICYRIILDSLDKTFKHSIYKLTALIDLAEYYFRINEYGKSKKYLSIIKKDQKYRNLLRNPQSTKLNKRYRYLFSSLDDENRVSGEVIDVNDRFDYVIIGISNSEKTYIGGPKDFIPTLDLIYASLRGRKVTFIPKEFSKNGKEKYHAKFIRLDRGKD